MRVKWIDILKGIGITTVVIGHSEFDYRYVFYWFHMPLFFFISGYLYRQKNFSYWKKIKAFMIPYLTFYVFITALRATYTSFSLSSFIHKDLEKFLMGGEMLKYSYGVFWFITALLVVTIGYHLINKYLPTKYVHLIVIVSYFLSYIDANYFKREIVFGDINTALFAIAFYHLGYLYKQNEESINKHIKGLTILSVATVTAVFLDAFQLHFMDSRYSLNIKYQGYDQLGLDILIPLSFITLIIILSKKLENIKYISPLLLSFGSSSMVIMFLHNSFLEVFSKYIDNLTIVIIASLFISWGFYFLFKTNKITRILFLGSK